jgi:SAM-dependent methyltransferase
MLKIPRPNIKISSDDIKEYSELMWVNTKVQIKNLMEFTRVIPKYYTNPIFAKIDSFLLISYLFQNPFAISKRFLKKRGDKNIYAYGETPLTTLDEIVKECKITSKDTVYELGCGRGRACFWLNTFLGCKVVGIEYIPEFVERANAIKNKFNIMNVEFRLQDMFQTNLSEATVVYLYGTCLEEQEIRKLINNMKKLKSGSKIVTISYPLTDYTSETLFEVMKRFQVMYPWGLADVYLQVKK